MSRVEIETFVCHYSDPDPESLYPPIRPARLELSSSFLGSVSTLRFRLNLIENLGFRVQSLGFPPPNTTWDLGCMVTVSEFFPQDSTWDLDSGC